MTRPFMAFAGRTVVFAPCMQCREEPACLCRLADSKKVYGMRRKGDKRSGRRDVSSSLFETSCFFQIRSSDIDSTNPRMHVAIDCVRTPRYIDRSAISDLVLSAEMTVFQARPLRERRYSACQPQLIWPLQQSKVAITRLKIRDMTRVRNHVYVYKRRSVLTA